MSRQPNWNTPIATVSGRLKQEYRFDTWRQLSSAGDLISNFGAGRGFEFIVAPRVQLVVGPPPYVRHSETGVPNGFGDMPLQINFRMLSEPASEGNYVLTFIVAATAPTGSRPNGNGAAVLTPILAGGKGWGRFDVQSNVGINLPAGDTARLGRQVLWNTAFQYRAHWHLWPELDVNSTFFRTGKNAGANQVFLTPALGFGRVNLYKRLRFSCGAGVQIAATRFHTYNHRWIFSVRVPF